MHRCVQLSALVDIVVGVELVVIEELVTLEVLLDVVVTVPVVDDVVELVHTHVLHSTGQLARTKSAADAEMNSSLQ